MKSGAKASSAASTKRQAIGLGHIVRGVFAIRDGSEGGDGSGAPSHRGRFALLGLSALAFTGLVLAVSSAFASKQVIDYIGGHGDSQFGSKGDEFQQPRDIGVNSTGAGGVPAGTVYVADDVNNRIQRFDPDGSFAAAWGANVLTEGTNEEQTLAVEASGGTYTLSFDGATTASLAYDATSAQLQTALRGLSTVGGSNLAVSGSGTPFSITFTDALAATNVAQIAVDDSNLSGSASTGNPVQGSGSYEICTAAEDCTAGQATGVAGIDNAKNGSLDSPQSVTVDGDTGNVYVSDRDNRRVNEYSAQGAFIRSFGWGVDATTAGDEYEVCPAANRCTQGSAGGGVGQIGSINTEGTYGIGVSPPNGEASVGKVFLADSQNRRVNTYDLDGQNPSSFGSETQFEESQPRKVAVDSRGIVYASDSGNGGEIQRYDTEDANGGGVGFLEPIFAEDSSPTTGPLLAGSPTTATSGLSVDPDSDGAGADEDVLYVLRDPSSGNTVVQQFGPTNEPGLILAPTAIDDTHGEEAGFDAVNGFGLDGSSGKLYVSSTNDVPGIRLGHRVYVLDEITAPAATLDPIATFDAHSATFTGDVNPNGNRTKYRFEYVDDAEFNANGFTNSVKVPFADVDLGAGTASVPVEVETPHHLIPSTTYHVRLVAKQTFTVTETIGGPLTFTTPGAAPSFAADATGIEADSATLRAAINPEGQEVTNYHFEWGVSESYGNTTSAGTLSAGGQPVAVEEELSGLLTPGQIYHYRLLATNGTGTTAGPDETFVTQAGPPQLPERGYEIASQYPTGGIPLTQLAGAFQTASEDGDRLAVGSPNPLPETEFPQLPDLPYNETGHSFPQYLFARGSDSWQDRADVGYGGYGWSSGLERMLVMTSTSAAGSGLIPEDARIDPDDQNGVEDVYEWMPNGTLVWISRDPRIAAGTPQTDEGDAEVASKTGSFAMSADGRTVVFKSQRQLLDADTTPGSGFGALSRLYEWEDGQLSFIGVRPDGSVPAAGSSLAGAIDGGSRYSVSRDGSRVIWAAKRTDVPFIDDATLYVQTDGQPTVEAVKEEGVAPLPVPQPYNVAYRGAAGDGSRVFFTSSSRLTPDSGASATVGFPANPAASDLYVYDVDADKLRDLTPRLDGLEDPSVDSAMADQARVLGVAANSEDGKRVYFVAEGQYPTAPNPEGALPSTTSPNLYLAELDTIGGPVKLRFIGSLGSADDGSWQRSWSAKNGFGAINSGKTALASPDGSMLGFGSTQSLTGQPLGGTEQLFAYEAETGRLDCASCPSNGSLPADDVNKYIRSNNLFAADWQDSNGLRRWVSTDGAVFFTTTTALLPGDTNLVNDVYEFREGALNLITSGKATTDSLLSDTSRDGSTVFFSTLAALAPQDKEPGMPKIYAARVGGGYSYVPPEAPCDFNAGACEGATSKAAQTPGAGTAAFEGPGNPKPSANRGCPKGKRKVHRRGKVRCVKRHRNISQRRGKHKRNAKHDRRASR